MFARVHRPLNNHAITIFVAHKNIGYLLFESAFANDTRLHPVFAKQLNFVQQIHISKHKPYLADILYAPLHRFVQFVEKEDFFASFEKVDTDICNFE